MPKTALKIVELLTPIISSGDEVIQIVVDPYQIVIVTYEFQFTVLIAIETEINGVWTSLDANISRRNFGDYSVLSILGLKIIEVFANNDRVSFKASGGEVFSIVVSDDGDSAEISVFESPPGMYVY